MKSFNILENSIQNYAWGSIDGISQFTGLQNRNGQPMAELWMGAHPASPSKIFVTESADPISLIQYIAENSSAILGEKNASTYGNKLPFLFKILSASSPLSLQVHPSKKQAEEGYRRENLDGIPLSSPKRNYKDDNHKPELLMALTPFTAMCGFRDVVETCMLFSTLSSEILNPAVTLLHATGNFNQFCKSLLELPESSIQLVIDEAVKKAVVLANKTVNYETEKAFATLLLLAGHYPTDIGILAPLYLNVLQLQPREALYLPAGVMHAYIEGTGLELMASSDNVLRGGLTKKHIDKTELLAILNPSTFIPSIISPGDAHGLFRYKTESTEFELSSVSLNGETVAVPADDPSIIIGAQGTIKGISFYGEECDFHKGTIIFIPATDKPISLIGHGVCYIASIPERNKEANDYLD